MDANFKLKQKNRGFNDPPLAEGLSYMVADCTLKEHLAECEKKQLNQEVISVVESPSSPLTNAINIRSTPVGPPFTQ
jgi:hypothetical protein